MTTVFLVILILSIAGSCAVVYYFSAKAVARRQGSKLSQALATTESLFSSLDDVPNVLISRDLRRGLVLIASHYIDVVVDIQPNHPHLWYLQSRMGRLNKIPTGFERTSIRSKSDRKRASLAFEKLAALVKQRGGKKILASRDADLSAAAAQFSAQHVAVETARQAAKDAENVRAYKQALNFAYQAQGLAKKLPPLMGKALADAVGADVERLENQLGRVARI